MPLHQIGNYVINSDNIAYIDLNPSLASDAVYIYFEGLKGNAIQRSEDNFSSVNLYSAKLAFHGKQAQALRKFFTNPNNVNVINT